MWGSKARSAEACESVGLADGGGTYAAGDGYDTHLGAVKTVAISGCLRYDLFRRPKMTMPFSDEATSPLN